MTSDFSPNALLALSELFRLVSANEQPIPGNVFVLVPVNDCLKLSRMLLAESIRLRERQE